MKSKRKKSEDLVILISKDEDYWHGSVVIPLKLGVRTQGKNIAQTLRRLAYAWEASGIKL